MGRSISARGGIPVSFVIFALALLVCGLASSSHAAVITLSHNNSVARIDPDSANPATAGMVDWEVQGEEQLQQQWFWYRVGVNPEQPINTISAASTSTFLGTRGLSTVYANANYSVQIDYLLTGGSVAPIGGIAHSDVAETISIQNTSGAPLDFHFFQYSNFDLTGGGNDSVILGTDPFGKFNSANQSDGVALLTESVSVVAPSAIHGEAGIFATTYTKLNDAFADVLNDNVAAGPGDVTWGFQWDLLLAPGQSFIISKDKHLQVLINDPNIPEPSSLGLIAVGLLACARRRRASV